MTTELRFSAASLAEAATQTLMAAGGTRDESEIIAANLIDANLTGHDSHGLMRLPRYLDWVPRGYLRFGQHVSMITDAGALVVLDGNNGFGQVLGVEATQIGIERARAHGLSLVALRRAGHLGRIGAWVEMAVDAGLVSIHFVNVANSLLVAPFGGTERRLSTAPMAVGVPNAGGDDFILDFSTARGAEGKMLVAYKSGKPIPEGYMIDGDGQPTTDPKALYGEPEPGRTPNPRAGFGALITMGDHKGSGLAIACELLAGALTGSGAGNTGAWPWNGMLSIFIDPRKIDSNGDTPALVSECIDFMRSCRPKSPDQDVMIPGDPERRNRRDRLANGIPMTEAGWDSFVEAAEAVGMTRQQLDDIVAAYRDAAFPAAGSP